MSQVIHKIWIGCDPSNFLNGRRGFAPEAIVIHRTGAPLGGIDSRCKQSNLHCSSHYAVGTGGEVHQYIDEKDTAFHAGIVVAATWKLLKGGKNPNLYTIAIEQEGAGNNPPSDLQYETTAALVSEIAQRWKIRIDAEHIVLHSEIRAGVGCPDSSFDRTKLLSLVTTNQGNVPLNSHLSDEVNLITDANVRDSPRLTARIVRIARAEASETISGFEDQGERINGNSCWYSTADGNYLWAGATDKPNPVRMTRLVTETAPTPPQPSAGSAKFGIQSLDDLLSKDNAAPICADAEPLAVGAIQDLLTGHGLPGLPTIATAQYGRWTPKTTAALQAFQKTGGLDVAASVDRRALQNMLNTPVSDPRASEVYLKLVLQAPSTGLHKILSLVAQMEGAGKFAAVNRNTDRAGLSFGLIQWAQKPGRLSDILVAMSASERALFITIFGNGDSAVADALVSHCRKPFGGVDPKTGETVSAAFNLIEEPWLSRFRQSALAKRFQQVQVQVALEAFSISYSRIRGFAPDLISERSVAFMLDVANQWGNSGVQKLYNDVHRPEMSETDLLEAIAEESVARMDDSLKAGVRGRREQFLQTPFLSDRPFVMDCS